MVGNTKATNHSAGLVSLASALLVLGVVSCGDKKKEEPAVDLSKFSGIYQSYLKSCGECHEADNVTTKDKVSNLDFSTEEKAFASLLQATDIKRQAGAGCAARDYVKAGSPATSYLYAIMDSSTRESFAAGSDALCTPLLHVAEFDAAGVNVGGVANKPTAEQKEAIRAWIEKGAPRN